VAYVAHVIVAEQDAAAKVVDPLDRGDPETLDTPQEILERYQISATDENQSYALPSPPHGEGIGKGDRALDF